MIPERKRRHWIKAITICAQQSTAVMIEQPVRQSEFSTIKSTAVTDSTVIDSGEQQ
jgi:hypothetical protein